MILTSAQKIILKAHILATADLLVLYTDGDLSGLVDLLNSLAAPNFIIWRNSVPQQEIMIDNFDWTRVDNLVVGKARIWEWMFDAGQGSINPSNPGIRAGIDTVWVGTAADLAVRAAVYVHCKRSATRIEKLFSTGTGTDASPATTLVDGLINYPDCIGL